MADQNANSPRNTWTSTGTALSVTVAGRYGNVSGKEAPDIGGEAAPLLGGGTRSDMGAVSRFGLLVCAVLRSTEPLGGERDENSVAGWGVVPESDFRLMYVRRFLRKAGEGTITERVFEGNYDQLVGYFRDHLVQ